MVGRPHTAFLDPSTADFAALLAQCPKAPLRERIAEMNLEICQKMGVDRVAALMNDIPRDRDESYARIDPSIPPRSPSSPWPLPMPADRHRSSSWLRALLSCASILAALCLTTQARGDVVVGDHVRPRCPDGTLEIEVQQRGHSAITCGQWRCDGDRDCPGELVCREVCVCMGPSTIRGDVMSWHPPAYGLCLSRDICGRGRPETHPTCVPSTVPGPPPRPWPRRALPPPRAAHGCAISSNDAADSTMALTISLAAIAFITRSRGQRS